MKSARLLWIALVCAAVAALVWLAVTFTGPKPEPISKSLATPSPTARSTEPGSAPLSAPAPPRAPSAHAPSTPDAENPPIARIVPVPAAPSAQPPLPKARPPGAPGQPPPAQTEPLTPAQATASRLDLESVRSMIRDYRSIQGENPVGTNAEIMKQLMGENRKNAQLGPPQGLNLNSNGELVDRWGTPFFFHQLSRADMEIRSAGPDRVMWTEDDLVTK